MLLTLHGGVVAELLTPQTSDLWVGLEFLPCHHIASSDRRPNPSLCLFAKLFKGGQYSKIIYTAAVDPVMDYM